jgi:ribonuclease J
MSERRKLGLHGLIGEAVALDAGGRLRGEPAVTLQGLPVEEDRDDFLDEARAAAADAAVSGAKDEAKLREAIRLAVRRKATQWTGKKPVVDVSIIRV